MPVEPWRIIYDALGVDISDKKARAQTGEDIRQLIERHRPNSKECREYVAEQKKKRRAMKKHLRELAAAFRDPPYGDVYFHLLTGTDPNALAADLDAIYEAYDPPSPAQPRPRRGRGRPKEHLDRFMQEYGSYYSERTGSAGTRIVDWDTYETRGPFVDSAQAILKLCGIAYSKDAIADAWRQKKPSKT